MLLGAGSTVAEVTSRPKKHRPPLDKGFFGVARATNLGQVRLVRGYIRENYGFDILDGQYDSLEAVMAHVYTDLFVPELTASASQVFSELVLLFNDRLAATTNNIAATPRRFLYRLIDSYLRNGLRPDELTVVTFNYDLQAEKTLFRLANSARGRRYGPIFRFPNCYPPR